MLVRGAAAIVEEGEAHQDGVRLLEEKYPQYREMAIERRPLIAIGHLTATSWRGDGERCGGGASSGPLRPRRGAGARPPA